jgi:hypothetical protein
MNKILMKIMSVNDMYKFRELFGELSGIVLANNNFDRKTSKILSLNIFSINDFYFDLKVISVSDLITALKLDDSFKYAVIAIFSNDDFARKSIARH